jgi:hypothetical protein
MIDRGVDLHYSGFSSDVQSSREALLALLDSASDLYAFFAYLKNRFNGNLFELEDESPREYISASALQDVKDFLCANVILPRGQYSLFNLYDFDIIPVELISSIYEILLGREMREKDKAFYTPKYLVDYILNRTIKGHLEVNDSCRVLDPSCGSGVFLVDSYRRIIEMKLDGALYTDDNEVLCNTLTESIFGIDVNPVAIDVAIFSLYLAVLDYKNPKTLNGFTLPDLKAGNLFVCDFFNESALTLVQEKSFDFIIGNPPWSNKPGLHVDYCKKYDFDKYMQNNDTCRSFILRSKDFCKNNKDTICCFVLHSKMFYMQKTPSKKFREEYLLTNAEIISIVELSAVRKLVFKDADAPATILTYKYSDAKSIDNRFEYISMKQNMYFRLFNIIAIEKTDVKSVQQKLLIQYDWAWKTLVYGMTGDIDNIIKLKVNHVSVKQAIMSQRPKILKGAGVKYNEGERKDASHLLGKRLLPSDAIDHFSINLNSFMTFDKPEVDRPRDERLFYAPYCLVLTGIDTQSHTLRAVYSEEDFVFKSAVYAVKGDDSQKPFLKNLTGLLNSMVYSYFNLLIGSSLGIEREQRLFSEVLEFPYIFSDDIVTQVERIQEELSSMNGLVDEDKVLVAIDILNKAVLSAMGLANNEFVDYALRVQIPQLTGKNNQDVDRTVDVEDLTIYSKYFYDYMSAVFSNAGKYIQIKTYPTVGKHYCAFEVLVLEQQPSEWISVISTTTDYQKAMYAKLSAHKMNELFYSLKDVLFFEENSFFIIKPNYYKNWHPAIAMLDISDVTDSILSGMTGGRE